MMMTDRYPRPNARRAGQSWPVGAQGRTVGVILELSGDKVVGPGDGREEEVEETYEEAGGAVWGAVE